MKKGLHFTSLPYKQFVMFLLAASAFFSAHGQNVAMHSGKTLERKDFKENSLRYNDFVNNRGSECILCHLYPRQRSNDWFFGRAEGHLQLHRI